MVKQTLIMLSLLIPALHASAQDKVSVQLRWTHQFQFAGYYMAKEKGFYQEADLDVQLIPGGPHALKPIDDVIKGNVDFAVTGSGAVIERIEGKPVVAVSAIMQVSPIVWITLKSSGIRSPHDMAGRDVLIMPPPGSAELLTMLEREGISQKLINIHPTSFDIEDLINGKTDAYDGYISNEPYYLQQQGIPYNLINPRDYGVNFYGDVLITSDSYIKKNPDRVVRFRDATLRGWQYALDNLEESVQLIHRLYASHKTLDHLRFEAKAIRELVMPDLVQVGHMNPGRWQFIAESYHNLNMTTAEPDLDGFLFQAPADIDYWLAIRVGIVAAALLLIAAVVAYKFRKLSLQLAERNQQLSELSRLDQLTQIKNRRGFIERSEPVLNWAKRKHIPCSFLMLDIDHFKDINDCYGHLSGDQALIRFAETLRRNRRKHDLVARIGGEEFAMLLLDAGPKEAEVIAERILDDVRQLVIHSSHADADFCISASIGIAPVIGELEDFWHEADLALYQAKAEGRDRIVVANQESIFSSTSVSSTAHPSE